MSKPSVIVVGLGAMGSSAAAVLARRGCRVVGFERLWRAHDRGSSHGDTRATRKAYVRDERYAPLVLEAYELWRRLEKDSGAELLREVGCLSVAPAGGKNIARSIATAEQYGVPYELLEPAEVARRWPTMRPPAGTVAFHEPSQAVMPPEKTVAVQIEMAARLGAELHFNTAVESWSATADGVEVQTSAGRFQADRLVVAGGAWSGRLLGDTSLPIVVERLLQVWVRPEGGAAQFAIGKHPRWVLEDAAGVTASAFPALEGQDALKMAFVQGAGTPTDPDDLEHVARPGEVERLVDFMAGLVPAVRGKPAARVAACLSGKTPDDNFVIGRHPWQPNVILGVGFSSHGFKFVPVIGEILADLALDGATRRDIGLFDPRRYAQRVASHNP